ncbi:MAG: hypothetical protein GX410_02665 [Elusimicrobia bacterium]|nr:hypothetical protein [Elusimicrobiota bacterium]
MKREPRRPQKGKEGRPKSADACQACGLCYSDYLSSGRLGCPNCYAAFRGAMQKLLPQGQGHYPGAAQAKARPKAGPLPLKSESLQEELQLAVGREDFERAALLRDILKQRGGS